MGTDAPRSKRHRRARFVLAGTGVIVTLALVAAGLAVWTVTRSFPMLSGEIGASGLAHTVTVHRDDAGIPQITAETSTDLFMAQGFVHAQDRFWEMDFRRHVTSGRLSELFGKSQVETDIFIRTLGWRAVAEEEVAMLDPLTLSYYQAYADGVNAYLATHAGAELSLEYAVLDLQNPGYEPEPWTPADSVAWLKAMAWDLRSNLVDEIDRALLATKLSPVEVAQLHPPYPYATNPTVLGGLPPRAAIAASAAADASAAVAVPTPTGDPLTQDAVLASLSRLRTTLASVPELLGPAGGDIGSNSWVVAGSLTDTGKPILANDPHLGPALPSVWYQVGLRCAEVTRDCPFDVAGYSFSGMPGVIIGHNSKVAWGFTNLGPDVADLYLEKVTGDSYEYDGAQKPLTIRTEKVLVAGGPAVKIAVRSTERGPIVSSPGSDDNGDDDSTFGRIATDYPEATGLAEPDSPTHYELSLQWTALSPGHTASAVFALDAATDWSTFRAAAKLFDVPSQNLLYADVDGNIGYQAPGVIPIRAQGDGTVPVAGWTSANRWNGAIAFEALPSSFNPVSGYIVTANNAVVGADYPHLITRDWDAGYRAAEITTRLQALIDAGTPLTTELMSTIQADNVSAIAKTLTPVLASLKVGGTAREAQALFNGWNYSLDADSAAAAYFNVVWRTLLADMFRNKLPEGTALAGSDRSFQIVASLLGTPDSPWWTNEHVGAAGRDSMLARVMNKAADDAVDLMGSDPSAWRWDTLHTLELTNASFGESGIAPIEWLFNRGPYPVAGGSSVVNATGWDAAVGYGVNWAPSMRQVVSLADWDDSTWVNLTGASGHAFHPNYVDQAPLWQHHRSRPWLFSPSAVAGGAEDTLTLQPR